MALESTARLRRETVAARRRRHFKLKIAWMLHIGFAQK
jgi:hypothetical protein